MDGRLGSAGGCRPGGKVLVVVVDVAFRNCVRGMMIVGLGLEAVGATPGLEMIGGRRLCSLYVLLALRKG